MAAALHELPRSAREGYRKERALTQSTRSCVLVLFRCSARAFVPGLLEAATRLRVVVGGDDLKSGQTKMKSVLRCRLLGLGRPAPRRHRFV